MENATTTETSVVLYVPQSPDHFCETFVPLLEVAATALVVPTTIRRWIWKKTVVARRIENTRGWEIDVTTLPPKYRHTYAHVRQVQFANGGGTERVAERYALSRESVRERAEFRLEAVLSLAMARHNRREGETLGQVEHRWYRNFSRTHPGKKFSLRSVTAWTAAFVEAQGNIDALIDRNDGEKQSGTRIPADLQQAFRDQFLRAHQPNLRLCYENVEALARAKGWGPIPSYDSFRRYKSKGIPKLARALLRESADKPRNVLPYVRRDPTSIGAYHTIQSDCREMDVPVRCDHGCPVCTGKKPHGHFPIWTAYIDIRSRRILGWRLSIELPDAEFILAIYRGIVAENGLNQRLYLDNGSNFVRGFGKVLRRNGRREWDGPTEAQMQGRFAAVGVGVVYAIVDNAQAKPIERMFRTFRHRFDEDFEAYRGMLGRKSEQAKEMYRKPSELPTLSELTHLLTLAITDYNGRPHSGRGMDGRSPDEVFYDPQIRIPRRDPEKAFDLLFYQPLKKGAKSGRVVGRNGVQCGNRIYRLSSSDVQFNYYGQKVDIRINPDNTEQAIVLDLCTGKYLCDAVVDAEATYDTRDEVTQRLIARTFSEGKQFIKKAKAYVDGSRTRLREHSTAKLAQQTERAAELEDKRQKAIAKLPPPAEPPVQLTGGLESALRFDESAPVKPRPTGEASAENASLRTRKQKNPHPKMYTYAEFARRHGFSVVMLHYYRIKKHPWPEGIEERFEEFLRQRAGGRPTREAAKSLLETATKPKLRQFEMRRGEHSYAQIAKKLGISRNLLSDYHTGRRRWPNPELKAKAEALLKRRSDSKK